MKKAVVSLATAVALSACGSQAPEDQPQTPAVTETRSADSLPPPRTDEFAAAWAEACPDAEKVGKALCKSKGLTAPGFTCDFSLGDEEYRRHTAELIPGDGNWVVSNPEETCQAN